MPISQPIRWPITINFYAPEGWSQLHHQMKYGLHTNGSAWNPLGHTAWFKPGSVQYSGFTGHLKDGRFLGRLEFVQTPDDRVYPTCDFEELLSGLGDLSIEVEPPGE